MVSHEEKGRKTIGHTRPQQPIISLDQPGRLRIAHVMALLGVAHSTLYKGIKSGRYPKPDGRDGLKTPYYNTETIRLFLQDQGGNHD